MNIHTQNLLFYKMCTLYYLCSVVKNHYCATRWQARRESDKFKVFTLRDKISFSVTVLNLKKDSKMARGGTISQMTGKYETANEVPFFFFFY